MILIQKYILVIIILTILSPAQAIQFIYQALQHQFFCFNQPSQKQSRYQVIIKSQKPSFSLQIFEGEKSVYQDQRLDIHMKEYSAYVGMPEKVDNQIIPPIITICIANKDIEAKTEFQIQFYHGIHLENNYQQKTSESFILQKLGEIQEVQNFVKSAYEMNTKYLVSRNQIISSIQTLSLIGTTVFIIGLFIIRIILTKKVTKQLKNRKLI